MKLKSNRKDIVPLFEKFIRDSQKGNRIQKNGNRISANSIQNYKSTLKYIQRFNAISGNPISINCKINLNKKEFLQEKKYWQKFYKNFTDLLYSNKCSDNYVGMLVKVIRIFLRYAENSLICMRTGFYQLLYSPKAEIPVFIVDQEKLRFLINDNEFDASLSDILKKCKDLFVFGCSVGLRFSDLINLNRKNLERIGESYYIVAVSQKTKTSTRVKIPSYCVDIIKRYKNKHRSKLLPYFTLMNFNKHLKVLGELAGWKYIVGKSRISRGVSKEIKTSSGKAYRYCDLLSSHVMRKTAISTMLILGMPEPLVRKISGHAANSKEFYKYVKYAESFVDSETDKVFDKLLSYSNVSV